MMIATKTTLTKNTARQEISEVSTPPRIAPPARPTEPAIPHIANALLRCAPSSNEVAMSASTAGKSSAPPRPCSSRAATSTAATGAKPPISEDAA